MLFIYSQHDSPRIDYVLQFIFEDCLKTQYTLVDHPGEVPEGAPFLNYSEYSADIESIWIIPHSIASEFIVKQPQIHVFEFNDHPVFFGHTEEGVDLPYDPISLCFFMLSRYEEYSIFKKDRHGRFPAKASVAEQNDFLEHPVVDEAIEDIRTILNSRWPGLDLPHYGYELDLTYDMDAPFAFRGKSKLKNTVAGIMELFFKFNTTRMAYVMGKAEDPYDIFDDLLQELSDYGHKATFFLLMEHIGKYNPAPNYKNERLKEIIEALSVEHTLGIHPSYQCNQAEKLKDETDRFVEICDHEPKRSRFHFIQMSLPASYTMLINDGIFEDHSMAFPDHVGFRAGTSRKFNWYDLSRELSTNLIIYPFCFMDATFEYYQTALNESSIRQKIEEITARIKKLGGSARWVFHNDIISSYSSKVDWNELHRWVLTSK